MKLTKDKIESLKEGNVILIVNPFCKDHTLQNEVTMSTIIVDRVGIYNVNGYTSSCLHPETYNSTSVSIDDLIGYDQNKIKGVFSSYVEAHKYLKLVNSGKFSDEVKKYHQKINDLMVRIPVKIKSKDTLRIKTI